MSATSVPLLQTSTRSGSGSAVGSVEAVTREWRSERPETRRPSSFERARVLLAAREHRDVGDLGEMPGEEAADHAGAGDADPLGHACTTPSGNGESFSAPACGDQEVVLDAQPATAFPVAAGLDREHHAGGDLRVGGPVGVRRLVGARADPVADRVRRLARIARLGDPLAHEHVELGEARARGGSGRSPARRPRAAPFRAPGSRPAARRGRGASCGRPSSRRRRPRSRTASARPRRRAPRRWR